MQTYSFKDKYNQTLKPWFFAFTVCVVANLVLYLLFSMNNRENIELSQNRPKIVMLPMENHLLNQNLQNIIEWMNDENPALIVSPNIEYGYSKILLLSNSLAMQKPNLVPIDYKSLLTTQIFISSFTSVNTIPSKLKTIADYFEKLTNLQTAFLPSPEGYPVFHANIQYPYVSELYTGLSIPIEFYGLGVNNSLITKLQPQKNTIIEIYVPDNKELLLSGKVLESCGSPELDSVGLNNIATKQLPDNIFNRYTGNALIIKIDWAPLIKTRQ